MKKKESASKSSKRKTIPPGTLVTELFREIPRPVLDAFAREGITTIRHLATRSSEIPEIIGRALPDATRKASKLTFEFRKTIRGQPVPPSL